MALQWRQVSTSLRKLNNTGASEQDMRFNKGGDIFECPVSAVPDMKKKVIHSTLYGTVVIIWSVYHDSPKVVRILLSRPELSAKDEVTRISPTLRESSCIEIDAIAWNIDAFLKGEDIRFSLDPVCLHLCSVFQQRVLRAEHAVPRGRVSTYQLIAGHLGKPKGARAVGTSLANNPFPIIIPCHRAIRSDGTIGGFQGGVEMKRNLLKMEGIAFRDTDHVATKLFFYNDRKNE
jgi:methylated-DNA-[protein]-cysteine S-methyltransferase